MEVVCPMCETVGFIPRKAAGHDVKCHNRDCLVPIFSAPATTTPVVPDRIPTADSDETGKETTGSLGLIALLILALLALGGSGVWWFGFAADRDTTSSAPPPSAGIQSPQLRQETNPSATAKKLDNADRETNTDKAAPIREISAQRILALMVSAAQEPENNRSKPFCRRLTAETFAQLGRAEDTRRELTQLTQVGEDLPYLHITPLLLLWQSRTKSQETPSDIDPDLEEAIRLADGLPDTDPYSAAAAVELAIAMSVVGRDDDARTLLAGLHGNGTMQRQMLAHHLAGLFGTFSLEMEWPYRPLFPPPRPIETAVVQGLVLRGEPKLALEWARSGKASRDRLERLASWATALLRARHPVDPLPHITSTLDQEPPEIRAGVLARVALAHVFLGKPPASSASRQAAESAIRQCPPPRPVSLDGLREIYQFVPDDHTGWLIQADAATCLAGAHSLAGKPEAAVSAFSRALAAIRTIGPSLSFAEIQRKAISTRGLSAFRGRLKSALQLSDENDVRRALSEYGHKCQALSKLAQMRNTGLLAIHRRAVEWKLLAASWKDVQASGKSGPPGSIDSFHQTTLPSLIALHFQAAGQTDLEREVTTMFSKSPVDQLTQLQQTVLPLALSRKRADCVTVIKGHRNQRESPADRFLRRAWMLRLAHQLATTKYPSDALDLIAGFPGSSYSLWRENAYLLLASQLGHSGQYHAVWEHATNENRSCTERVALLRGLLRTMPLSPKTR